MEHPRGLPRPTSEAQRNSVPLKISASPKIATKDLPRLERAALTATPGPKVKPQASSAKNGPELVAPGLRSQHPDCRASLPEAWKAAPTCLTRAGPGAAVVSLPQPARGPKTGRQPCMQEVDS